MSMNATTAEGSALQVPLGLVEPLPIEVGERGRTDRFAHLRRKLVVADAVAGALSGLAVSGVGQLSAVNSALAIVVLAVAWPLTAFMCGLYGSNDLRSWASGVDESPKLVLAALLISWPVYGGITLLGHPHGAISALVASIVTAAAAGLARAGARASVHRSAGLREQTLIIGSGDVARRLTERLAHHKEVGLDVVGHLDDDAHEAGHPGSQWLGRLDDLPTLIASGAIDRVIIAFTRSGHEDLLQVVRVCRDAGVTVDIVPRLFEFLDGARVLDQIGSMPLLSIDSPRFSRSSRAAKRALDVAIASLALLALSPVIIAIAVAIKLDSRGPLLFVQRRPGRRGVFFPVYKFRSMCVDAGLTLSDDRVLLKLPSDDRVTRVGRLIRRFSLDELPQLINVLRGDMSLVGPRPIVAAEADALTESWQSRRSDLRPGLTGPWQIQGRSHIPFDERLALDYQYVAGWSLARDIKILLATLPAVISGHGAY